MELELVYEVAIEAAIARVNDLSARRRMKDSAVLKMWHEQAVDELTYLGHCYNQLIIDKYKELTKNGNA